MDRIREIKKETLELRDRKAREKREVKELNNIGKRLEWLRDKLGLTKTDVAKATGIPETSYKNREFGVRTDYYEEYVVLARYFNNRWQEKYGDRPMMPHYNGQSLRKITTMFLLFGRDEAEDEIDSIIRDFKQKLFKAQKEHYEKEEKLKRQIEKLQ